MIVHRARTGLRQGSPLTFSCRGGYVRHQSRIFFSLIGGRVTARSQDPPLWKLLTSNHTLTSCWPILLLHFDAAALQLLSEGTAFRPGDD